MYSAVLQHIEELHVLQYGGGNDEKMSMKAGLLSGQEISLMTAGCNCEPSSRKIIIDRRCEIGWLEVRVTGKLGGEGSEATECEEGDSSPPEGAEQASKVVELARRRRGMEWGGWPYVATYPSHKAGALLQG